jgi:hypothetical protein
LSNCANSKNQNNNSSFKLFNQKRLTEQQVRMSP